MLLSILDNSSFFDQNATKRKEKSTDEVVEIPCTLLRKLSASFRSSSALFKVNSRKASSLVLPFFIASVYS